MRAFVTAFLTFILFFSAFGQKAFRDHSSTSKNETSKSSALVSLAKLDQLARENVNAKPHTALADESNEILKAIKNADPLESGNASNYIKALAQHTKASQNFAQLVQTFLYGGTLQPETKMAMILRVAQVYGSSYTAAHAQRWLKASDKGQAILTKLRANNIASLSQAEQLALVFVENLTRDVHGVSDADFQKVRGSYNDSQIVELTMVTCFANYFTRFNEALNLPVESWVLDSLAKTPASVAVAKQSRVIARVALVSDAEMNAASAALTAAKQSQTPASGLGLGIANSQRAFLRVPALGQAWREYGAANRAAWSIPRDIQLHISFAVSMANGCRYCTLHQVLGLRRLGVDPAKLLAMKKDDSALSARELAAVTFARKLTKEPASITEEDFAKLKAEFGEQGAVEVAMQTCGFAFMNRFTDGLRLPSEDEAIRVYQETYGAGSLEKDWKW
jgi:AhpD family alkylhydroperoxidase